MISSNPSMRTSSKECATEQTIPERLDLRNFGIEGSQNSVSEILFITSYPPRECGIATYSQDLITAIENQFSNSFTSSICALESNTEQHLYLQKPKRILNTDSRNSFKKTAFQINRDENIKLVVMQHEFGFFSKKEDELKEFFTNVTKPILFVFHTVLPNPDHNLRRKVNDIVSIASSIVVMTSNAATILINEYGTPVNSITIIPHGTHLVLPLDRKKLKQKYQLSDRKVLATFGLLGTSKSIETTLDALPSVIKSHPEVLFLVLGKTHPSVVKQDGERYRTMLHDKVKELHLENHVRFINEYLQLPILLEYLQLADIYLFTSKDPNQAVSGTFSYAVSCGCPVISTPIPHAKEVIGNNNGIIVDFENPNQLAKAILSLLDNEQLRNSISSNSLHKMASTAWQNSAIMHAMLFKNLIHSSTQLKYTIPPININHIQKMTTHFGLIQFSKIANPDLKSGYTLDDNSRGLIALCQNFVMHKTVEDLDLIGTYLDFIRFCILPNGLFLNYVNDKMEFTPQNVSENLDDSNGRAIWALGYVCSLKNILPQHLTKEAEKLMALALLQIEKIHSPRAMAFCIKGLYYQNINKNQRHMIVLSDRLMKMYAHEKTKKWHWYENCMTYGNSVLPEAMLCAYLSTKNLEYRSVAIESFNFLLSEIFADNTIKVISNKGWHHRGQQKPTSLGGEQPIDIAYTIVALQKFYDAFQNDDYKQKAIIAFNWFLGKNHLHQIVYNPRTGGCYDGLEEDSVNLNQGAESTISYLLARLAIEKIYSQKMEPTKPSRRIHHETALS
jgi:glycosyltransferase involved in cell wall biosynthesis